MGTAERTRVNEGNIEVVKDMKGQEVNSGILKSVLEFRENNSKREEIVSSIHCFQKVFIKNIRNEEKAMESLTVKISMGGK